MSSYIAKKIANNVGDNNEMKKSIANWTINSANVNDKEILRNLQNLNAFFNQSFNKEPEFFVRVPGRVNIIGEHVDYNLLPVLPMAIDSCILLAVASTPNKSILELKNLEYNTYANYKCHINEITINVPEEDKMATHGWYNYFLCGFKGICDILINRNGNHLSMPLHGMQVAVHGTIPPASGLSSSSALVCSAIIATAYVHKMDMNAKYLAELAARSERFIGTESGGMDQAICFLAENAYAQKIEFHPKLQTTLVPLPDGLCLVVANSMIKKNKAATSDYNERVIECRLACRLITHFLNITQWSSMLTFKKLMDSINNETNYEKILDLIKKYVEKDIYTREELCDILKLTDSEFSNQFLTTNTQHMEKFKIKQRALHVIQESQRVEKFCNLCKDACLTSTNSMEYFNKLKELISESHNSLKLLYECSHPELDKLVDLAASINIGARLMGAGWGGCILALCSSMEECQQLISLLKQTFYKNLPNDIIEKNLFIATPKDGAEIIFNRDLITFNT